MPVMDDTVPPARAAPFLINQGWAAYSKEDHRRWTQLHERQRAILEGRACRAFLDGLEALDLHGRGVPRFEEINARLRPLTGWRVCAVPGLVPDDAFFACLASRIFPASNFIRPAGSLDYLSEPDVFHDVFGHVPMLTDPVFADYMQAYGAGGLRALGLDHLHHLARLYWYTVEFGLLQTPQGLRIYGAGIVSSKSESLFALEESSPNRLEFDLIRVMRTRYRIDDFQQTYFVVGSIDSLLEATLQDFAGVYAALDGAADLEPDEVLPSDGIITRGDQSHAHARASQ